jgi:uncharacterized membrane protein
MGSDNFKKLSDIAHIVVLCSFIGLVSLLIAELAVEKASTMQWLVRLLPLLIFFPGLVYANVRTHILLCFVCLLYFMIFVQAIFAGTNIVWPILTTIELVVMFIAAMLFARWRSKSQA